MTQNSIEWFRTNVKSLARGVTPDSLMDTEKRDRIKATPAIGTMNFMFYDPKWKDTLPYYDQFPLMIVIETYKDRFLGLNLHYLAPSVRAVLLGKLLEIATDKRYDEKTKLVISWQMLKAAQKYPEVRPCVKMYLKSHMRSKFLRVHAREWQVAIFLPVERFKKQSKYTVWGESNKRI